MKRNGSKTVLVFIGKAQSRRLRSTVKVGVFSTRCSFWTLRGRYLLTVYLEFGNGIDLKYTGKVAADRIDFKVQRSGSDTAQPFVAKKM
jgi:hypothetical protein